MKFQEYNFEDSLMEGLEAFGFEETTPIQERAIPAIMEGKDLIASAQTGTGKTAAFLLPIIHKIIQSAEEGNIQALIVVPTRELAMQIDQQLEGFSYYTAVSSIAVYGGTDGTSFTTEKIALSKGADIVIGTPGRLLAHLNMGYVKVSALKYLILDEADRMLDMGFNEDIMRIISNLPEKRQNLLFSATMPVKINDLARKILKDPEEISIAMSKPAEKVLQVAYVLYDNQKIPMIKYLLEGKRSHIILVFCSTKSSVKQLNKELTAMGLSSREIHSDLEQSERKAVLREFSSRNINILVATDVLSRGIDIEDIDLVINYDVPNDAEDYIHRIGRTARAEAEGVAITLINNKEQGKFLEIEKLLGNPVAKLRLPAHLGDAPDYNPKTFKGNTRKGKFHRRKK